MARAFCGACLIVAIGACTPAHHGPALAPPPSLYVLPDSITTKDSLSFNTFLESLPSEPGRVLVDRADLTPSFKAAEERWMKLVDEASERRKWFAFWAGLLRHSTRLGGTGGGVAAVATAEDNPGTAKIAGGIAAVSALLGWLLNDDEFATIAEQCKGAAAMRAEITQFFSYWEPKIQAARISPSLRNEASAALKEFGEKHMMPSYLRCMGSPP